jgi:hypothetical protein
MVFWDTETIPTRVDDHLIRQSLRLGVAHYWRKRRDNRSDTHEWYRFTDVDAFWSWVERHAHTNSTLLMIAHNLAFDAQTVQTFVILPKRGWVLQFLYENGSTRIVRWGVPTPEYRRWIDTGKAVEDFRGKRWTRSIVMIDNLNLFAGSIEQWGEALGLPKLTRPPYTDDDDRWWPYCTRDVEIMVRLWEEWFTFLDEHRCGTCRYTIGSQAFSAFRHGYMRNRIVIHANDDVIRLEREAYSGGRVECFVVGRWTDGPYYKLDVNSMYPYVMSESLYPTVLQAVKDSCTVDDLRTLRKRFGVIARVELDTDHPAFPVRENGRNVYPVGQFATTLSSPELDFALDNGWIVRVGKTAVYRMRPVFRWYVKHFYDLKLQYEHDGDKLRRTLVKLLLNSLYGKFGQAGYEDRLIGTTDPGDVSVEYGVELPSRTRYTLYRAGGSVIKQYRTGNAFNSFVAIAAHVTAYARMYLWRLILIAGREHVYYVDTDSLIVDGDGYRNLAENIQQGVLGMLKVEEVADQIEIRAPKDYRMGEHVVRKGIPLDASLLDQNVYELETWPSMRTHIANGHVDTYYNRSVTKHLVYTVNWGNVQSNGRITPYEYGASPLFL